MKVLEALSKHISMRIKQSDPLGPVSLEIMEYQLGIWLNAVFTLMITALFGWWCGMLPESMTALTAFFLVRRYSGGVHLKSISACVLVSACLFVLVPFIPLSTIQTIFVTGITVVLFFIFSPNIFEERNPSALDPYFKTISVLLVSSNFLLQSSEIALICIIQALLLMPFWKGGEQQ